ncbi:hypothetical protein [Coleofasciculus sp.]|uniref:hypothetical protein n=1 Tax=Coleofasciculus sp. TaxID=3100458 RepID=UPI003A3E3770
MSINAITGKRSQSNYQYPERGYTTWNDEPLEAPLKSFPPNLISAIQTWLEEI